MMPSVTRYSQDQKACCLETQDFYCSTAFYYYCLNSGERKYTDF